MPTPANQPLIIYVDIDDTLIRSVGPKHIPIPATIAHVRRLHADGATLYCWSTGGAAYARQIAEELTLANLFQAFLPKPQIMLDDQPFGDWRRLICVHPLKCDSESVDTYHQSLDRR